MEMFWKRNFLSKVKFDDEIGATRADEVLAF